MEKETKLVINNDKLVDILMHSVTHEDIDGLKIANQEEFKRINNRFEKIDARFDKIDARFDKLENKIDNNFKWIVSIIIIGVIMPILAPVAMKYLGG